jgi:hypothetical protein
MKILGRWFHLAGVAAVALACASTDEPRIGTSHDPLYAFPAQATFSWSERDNRVPDDPRITHLGLGPLIERVAAEEFAAHGYRLTDSNPDYLMSYQVRIDWFRVETSEMLGSVTLQLAKADSRHRVWSGFGRSVVHPALTPEVREQRMRKAIQQMLENFPPGVKR